MSDTDNSGFGKFVPGFEFMQNLARQATGGLAQGVQQAAPQLPNLGSWVAPTFNVEDLDKRIQELKAVHFWLDQNSRALAATIQALEVQKMTLSTLQGMNFSLGDVANAMKIKTADMLSGMSNLGAKPAETSPPQPAPTQFAGLEIPPRRTPTAAPAPQAEPEEEEEDRGVEVTAPPPAAAKPDQTSTGEPVAPAAAGGVIDPMQWWGALSQQFQTIAANAMKDASSQAAMEASKNMATTLTREAMKTATDMTAGVTRNLVGKGRAKSVRGAAWPLPSTSSVKKTGTVKADADAGRPAPKAANAVKASDSKGEKSGSKASAGAKKAATKTTNGGRKPAGKQAATAASRKQAGRSR